MNDLKRLLMRLGACAEAVEWVGERSLAQAWQDCERADWMLWLAGRMVGQSGWPTRQQLVLAACACAERTLVAGEERPRITIDTGRRWAHGSASLEEVFSATPATPATSISDAAAFYAVRAGIVDAADCAAYTAAAASTAARNADELSAMAEIVRTMLTPGPLAEESE